MLMSPCWQKTMTRYTWAEKFESFERINSIRETNGNFDSCNSCKRLVPSRLHELHDSKFPFVSRIEFIRSKLSNFSAHVYGVHVWLLYRWHRLHSRCSIQLSCHVSMLGVGVVCAVTPASAPDSIAQLDMDTTQSAAHWWTGDTENTTV